MGARARFRDVVDVTFGVAGSGFRGLGLTFQGLRFRAQGLGFRVQGFGPFSTVRLRLDDLELMP